MTNRDKYILKRNECDMLVKIQEYLGNDGQYCVIDALTGSARSCQYDTCEECIQKWLNEES